MKEAPVPASRTFAALLLDIEGTTTPLDFVTRTLFPYARIALTRLSETSWEEVLTPDLAPLEAEYAREAVAGADLPTWDREAPRNSALRYLLWLMDRDRKSPALKSIQGKLWRHGYESGELKGQVYPDVPEALRRWKARGGRSFVYSSGSVLAQQLLFRYAECGDLTSLFDGYFDTAVGSKREPQSYEAIARAIALPPGEILFVSDVAAELAAARAAGMQGALSLRPGNLPEDPADYPTLTDFGTLVPESSV